MPAGQTGLWRGHSVRERQLHALVLQGVPQVFTGTVEDDHHWVTVSFTSGETFLFDKNHPEWVLYPNRLCLYLQKRWGEPLTVNRALNAYLLTMSFLTWHLQPCIKTAKFGRKVLRADVQQEKQTARLFLDKNFNTL